MTVRRVTLFFSLLAVALNVVGAPLVRVHMANMEHVSASAMPGMEHCPQHMNAGASERDSSPASGHLACCKSGACNCGCLHAAAISVLAFSTRTAAPGSVPAAPVRAAPANTLDDPLRPPIT
jgi:hypothetical protein